MLTTVILTPGACEGRLRAALDDTNPLDPVDPLDPRACAKVVFRVRETLLYVLETQKSLYCVFKKYKVYFWEK